MKQMVRLESLEGVGVGKTWTDEDGKQWRVMQIDFAEKTLTICPEE